MTNFFSDGGWRNFLFNTVSALTAIGSVGILGWQILHGENLNPVAVTIVSAYTGLAGGLYASSRIVQNEVTK